MKRTLIAIALTLLALLSTTIYFLAKFIYPDKVTVKAHKVFDCNFGRISNKGCTLAIGPDYDALVLTTNIPDLPDTEDSLRFVEKESKSNNLSCKLNHFRDSKLTTIDIKSVPGPFLLPQPCGGGRYVIATASCCSPEKDLNAFVYDSTGKVVDKLKLGIDVNQMQCDRDGNIWATYDTGKKKRNDPLNAGGLTCFDIHGKALFQYNSDTPPKRIPAIIYGLALNVISPDEIVVSTDKAGQVVKLLDKSSVKPLGIVLPEYCGFVGFSNERLLYSYSTIVETRLAVVDIKSKRVTNLNPVDENGQTIEYKDRDVACRGSRLYFHNRKTVYYLDVNELDKNL